MDLINDLFHKRYKNRHLFGRYISPDMLSEALRGELFKIIGYSVKKEPIRLFKFGKGKRTVLAWSQMHGNESTTTKAIVDIISFLKSDHPIAQKILESITFYIIPQLNPDGSRLYTRVNFNLIDLNRDALDLSQPESQVLRMLVEDIQPDYCLNLHDQRSIYNVGDTAYPATLSFLSPSSSKDKKITKARKQAMCLISTMNKHLQKIIPQRVGRYDDSFNINCTGDMFSSMGIPTILFEAGLYSRMDYHREHSREFIFVSICKLLEYLTDEAFIVDMDDYQIEDYFKIPENNKRFFDVILTSNSLKDDKSDIGIMFDETLENNRIVFKPKVIKEGDLKNYFSHIEYKNISLDEALERSSQVANKDVPF